MQVTQEFVVELFNQFMILAATGFAIISFTCAIFITKFLGGK